MQGVENVISSGNFHPYILLYFSNYIILPSFPCEAEMCFRVIFDGM